MDDERTVVDQALDLLVYAPLGLALEAKDMLPKLAERGRGQIALARVAGRFASVRLGGAIGCPACDAGRGCGAGVFGRLLRRRPLVLDIENRLDAVRGQAVVVGLPDALYLALVNRLYLLPLLAGLAAAAAGYYLASRAALAPAAADAVTLLGALLGGAAAVWRNRTHSGNFRPKLLSTCCVLSIITHRKLNQRNDCE